MISLCRKTLIKYVIFSVLAVLIMAFAWTNAAAAAEINDAIRTIPLNASGEQKTLTVEQVLAGQRKFNSSCAQCHLDGGTKTNPSVDLGPQTLALATPPRNNLESLMDYLKDPTTYDGLESISELHPSTLRTDLFPKMRDLTEEDLTAIASYILIQPKIDGAHWAGGKPKR